MRKGLFTGIAAAVAALLMSTGAFAATELRTAAAPSPGCCLVAVEGDYNGNAVTALDRINEIRKEACDEGVWDPRDKTRQLQPSDYSPISWSSALEYIARVRAAEASILIGHDRPNGNADRCFSVTAPDGTQSFGEVLAWNWENTMVSGVDQWYEEKTDWVNQNPNAVTGHYTQMINPNNRYVGLACFTNPEGIYYNSVSGEFSAYGTHSQDIASPTADCRVILDVQTSGLSDPGVYIIDRKAQSSDHLDKGDVLSCVFAMISSFGGRSAAVFDAGTVVWTSSSPAVASVNQDGLVQMKGVGSAVITAAGSSGNSASLTVEASHEFGGWTTTKAATVSEEGKQTRTCAICGEKETKTIAKVTPVLKLGRSAATVKKTKSASVKVTVGKGDSIKVSTSNKAIATAKAENGKVIITAKKKAGTAVITVKTATGLSEKIKVTVPKAKTTKITCASVSVKRKKKAVLKVKLTPAYSDDKITYKSADKKIATVSKKGVVTGKKKGKTTITITSGKKKIKVTVRVK